MTVFAADKLSDITGLRRGVETFGVRGVEDRMGTSIESMGGHYRESVEMIASSRPGSAFLPALRVQLARLDASADVALRIRPLPRRPRLGNAHSFAFVPGLL